MIGGERIGLEIPILIGENTRISIFIRILKIT